MPGVPYIVQAREKRRNAVQRNPTTRIALGCSTLISLAVIFGGLAVTVYFSTVVRDLPSLSLIPALIEPPHGLLQQPTRLYDRTGENLILILEHPWAEGREYLFVSPEIDPFDSETNNSMVAVDRQKYLSPALVNAAIATTDPEFWVHPGYSLRGLFSGEQHTLAQRLVADLMLHDEPPSFIRNIRERLLAAQLTAYYGKPKIIEWALNSARYGPLIYGADAAARVYFNKPGSDVSLAEAALLAAVAEAPALNPISSPKIAIERQKEVLEVMMINGFINPEETVNAKRAELSFRSGSPPSSELAPAFTKLVFEQISPFMDIERLERGGLIVITSLDYDIQIQANCATRIQIERMKGNPEPVYSEGSPECSAARLLPTLPLPGRFSEIAFTASVVVIDPRSGHLLAMVGDSLPGKSPAQMPGRSPGSLVTPFIYLTAFARGLSPASLVWDIPSSLPADLKSLDIEGEKYSGPLRLRTALANDYMIPAVQVLEQIGSQSVLHTAQQLGISSLTSAVLEGYLKNYPLFTGGEASLIELAQAYGVLANQGVLVGYSHEEQALPTGYPSLRPISVLQISTVEGAVLMSCQENIIHCNPQARSVLSSQLAYLANHILSDESARWASLGHPNSLEIGRPAAAKLGQTVDITDAWTIGYTPHLLAGVWIGTTNKDISAEPALRTEVAAFTNSSAALWHAILQYASQDLPPENWTMPPGIEQLDVCDPSGLLPTTYCPTITSEVFLTENLPVHYDNLYRVFQVNRETDRLATVFTPQRLIDEKVYLVVPPEALEWAHMAGLATPPEDYDIIYSLPPASSDVRIVSPAIFDYVNGKVQIIGSAGGESLAFYRLQIGEGLNPRGWIQLGEESRHPVFDDILAEWNTEGLSGLYTLQLQVVRQNQRVETFLLQVTVDNQPPHVNITHPEPVSTPFSAGKNIWLHANASDNVGIAFVEFHMDGKLLASLVDAPYTLAWNAQPGARILKVRAIDLAGNVTEDQVEFTVIDE
jgi:membrane carboxypeptidase/penicillin-binding protein